MSEGNVVANILNLNNEVYMPWTGERYERSNVLTCDFVRVFVSFYEPKHEKTYLLNVRRTKTQNSLSTCAFIKLFFARMKKHCTLGCPKCAQ